ncbi:Dabb family protein [Pseudohoeflea coraliihabitans]|uniref:Dabb family protein n=1 Tax=Pseudohoeflea coraliihabitans TaxID=2860393 RepID=A0ABS6WRR2_9HYPH|nr:Dabb family protein [Pseudohoeflea sp. DP4N28-3]MBW3098657.1 Dabb family protein [Pseudohoeflea sp. DP4N28-3]
MLRHIVFFRAKDPANAEAVYEGLKMLTRTPHARFMEVGRVSVRDTISEPVDFVVYGEFDDAAALAAFKAEPLYQQSIEVVRPLRDLRIAADFESEQP